MSKMIGEIIVSLLAAGGLLAVCWLMFGHMLVPVGNGGTPVYAVIPALGGGEELEHAVSGLLWLRSGDLARFTIVVADFGLDESGLAVAQALLRREPDLIYCPLTGLEQYIKERTQNGCL